MNKISKGVMEVQKIDGKNTRSVIYQVACSCTDPNCNLIMDLTWYEKDGDVDIIFWKDINYNTDYTETKLESYLRELSNKLDRKKKLWDVIYKIRMKISDIVRLYRRIRDAYKILIGRDVKFEGGLIIYGEKQIETLIQALVEGLNFVYPSKNRYLTTLEKDGVDGRTDIGVI